MLYLKSVDMGLVATDVPEFYKIQYGSDITDRLRYIMKLYNNEIHIIAPTEIKTVFDLEGKRIEAPKDVGLYSAKAIFSRLKINVTYNSTHLNDDTGALQEVIDGRADAWIVGTAKVMPIARNLERKPAPALGLDPVRSEAPGPLSPVRVTSDEYPELNPPGEKVDTRRRRHPPRGVQLAGKKREVPEGGEVRRCAVFQEIDEFAKPPRHPKWKEASVPRSYPGGNSSSPRRTGSIVGVRNTSTRLTRLLSQGSRTLWRSRDTPTCPRKNSKSCTLSSWNGIATPRTKAPRLRRCAR